MGMTSFKIEGIKEYLEVFDDKIVLSPKDKETYYSQEKKLEQESQILFEQIFKIDFESAGKFTNGYIHFILKDKLDENVFADAHKDGCVFLFDFFRNEKMKDIVRIITNRISDQVGPQPHDTKKMIKELMEIKDLHQKGALTKKEYDEQLKNLVKKI
ncbi:MAG: hypothetical protein A2381_05250 [Bdellovibrionales bacterium RIFOXYB1_FULL_37_110]|nr:MAG: hypothetical protein A2381_05250 [Bdellovibrionales bacterium RIFOXYB1_FULL_37_110]OFZ61841.1 MAG: hypothetical protein A2577_18835 [Bdellovibrionales bacterium RIFOXYD1_FULL_36_51]